MVISPLRCSVYMMLSCAMLTPSRSSRSLDAHLSSLIVARKSEMMVSIAAVDRHSSYHVNYHNRANHIVNMNGSPSARGGSMRFALMIEPQQGLGYGDQVAIAKRAEANGFEALFRSDHYASFPGATGQPTTDAWTVIAGLARETDRLSLGALVSPVTFRHRRHVREDRHHRRRDERRTDRGGRRRGLERPRAPPARAAVPGLGERVDASRTSSRSCTACGASRTAGRTTARRDDPGRPLLPEAGRGAGSPDREERPRAAPDHLRRLRRATRRAAAARMCDEFNLSGVRRRPRRFAKWTPPARRSAAIPPRSCTP